MTQKENAKELMEKMLGDNNNYLNKNIEIDKLHAKKCAIISIEETINKLLTLQELHFNSLSIQSSIGIMLDDLNLQKKEVEKL